MNIALIPLGGKRGTIRGHAIVSMADYARCRARRWYWNKRGYAASDSCGERLLMHRFVLGAPRGREVDHINGDRLDNSRTNLRESSRAENGRNRTAQPFNTTGYKGVGRHGHRFRARIMVGYKEKHIGVFDTAAEAHAAYLEAAVKYHGEYANGELARVVSSRVSE